MAPSLELIQQYLACLFGYLDGWIALRSYPEAGQSGKPAMQWVHTDDNSAEAAYQFAVSAHAAGRACYVIPGTVAAKGKAGSDDVAAFGTILIDIDSGDTEAKLVHLIQHLGQPSMVLESGGITEVNTAKLHCYWKLSEPAEQDELQLVLRLREQIALKVGGDTHFKSAHQPIRIAGSIYHKTGEPKLVTIRDCNEAEYHLGDLLEAIDEMPVMAGIEPPKQATLDWQNFNDVKASPEELMTMKVHAGGTDGISRFEALSSVMGYIIRRCHQGQISQQGAWDEVWGYNLSYVRPSWPEPRIHAEMKRLWNKHCQKYGEPTLFTESGAPSVPDFESLYLADYIDRPMQPPADIIEPRILTENSVMLFAGAPKVGKSDFLLSMFIHMAAGEPFLHMVPREPLRIFYLQLEIHGYYISERIQQLGVSFDIKQKAANNLVITPKLQMLLDGDGVKRCAEHIRQRFGKKLPHIICIDPIRNVFDGGKPEASENDNHAMMFFLQERILRLRDAISPDSAIILVHHTRKMPRKKVEEETFQAISGASALRGFYDSGLLLLRPDEVAPERHLITELRNGPEIPPYIVEKQDGHWTARSILNERLAGEKQGRRQDAERKRKYDTILQLIHNEASEGRLYTMNQFAEAFESKHGLGSKDSMYERLGVLATQGFIKFTKDNKSLGLDYCRSRFGFLCVEAMSFRNEQGDQVPVLPTHYKAASTGACLEVENPHVWVYQEGEISDE